MNRVTGTRFWLWLLTGAAICVMAPALVSAAPPAQDTDCAQEYTVQANDWLSKIAEQYLGDAMDYPMIADATNHAHQADARFAQIGDHDFIEPGWILCIPAATDATEPKASQPEAEASRITFDAGGTTAFVDGKLAATDIDRYVVKAQAGQLMWVSIWSQAAPSDNGPDPVMSIWGADGTVLISDHAGATEWSGSLPSSQDYILDVISTGQAEVDYTLGVGIPAPVQPDPNLTQTEVIQYQASMPDGPAQEGDCWTSSNLLLRDDAWRCNVGANQISDPCFSIEGQDGMVVCGADPVTGDPGFHLKLTKPLPADAAPAVDPDEVRTDAWYVKLADGKICGAAGGATFGAFTQRANYSCHSDADPQDLWIFGDLMQGTIWQGVQGTAGNAPDGMPTGTDLQVVQIATVWQ